MRFEFRRRDYRGAVILFTLMNVVLPVLVMVFVRDGFHIGFASVIVDYFAFQSCFGLDTVVIAGDTVSTRQSTLGLASKKRFEASSIRRLRYEGGRILLHYRYEGYTIGSGLDPDTAEKVIGAIAAIAPEAVWPA